MKAGFHHSDLNKRKLMSPKKQTLEEPTVKRQLHITIFFMSEQFSLYYCSFTGGLLTDKTYFDMSVYHDVKLKLNEVSENS